MGDSKSRTIDAEETTQSQPFEMLESKMPHFAVKFQKQLLEGGEILVVTGNDTVGVGQHLGRLDGIMKCRCQRHERVAVWGKLNHHVVSEVKMTHVMSDNKFSTVCFCGVETFLGTEETNFQAWIATGKCVDLDHLACGAN